MIDLRNEAPISLAAAARLLPPGRRGRPVSLSCIFRWIADGVQTPNGDVVRLEAARMGGRWLTSVAALERFAERQTPVFADGTSTSRTPGQRERANARAAKQLEAVGI